MPLSITKISDFGVYFGIIAYRNFPFWEVFAEVSFSVFVGFTTLWIMKDNRRQPSYVWLTQCAPY